MNNLTLPITHYEMTPMSDKYFIGRRKEINLLKNNMLSGNVQAAFVTGPGGIGKTSLVRYFCNRFEDSFPAGINIHYSSPNDDFFDNDIQKVIDLKKKGKRLLVIEEADRLNNNALKRLHHIAYENNNLKLIFVARSLFDVDFKSVKIVLNGFSESDFIRLFEKRIKDVDENILVKFYNKTSGHPLFSSLVASYLQEGNLKWSELLNIIDPFRESGIVGLDGQPIEPTKKTPQKIITVQQYLEKNLVRSIKKDPDLLYKISPRDFELFIAEILDRLGYNITLTPPSKDGGVDIYAAKSDVLGKFLFLVECKKYAPHNKVKVDIVRSLYGVVQLEKATAGIIATTSSFTRGAKELQNEIKNQIHLKDFIDLKHWLKLI